jgi:hypothetical protein
MSTATGKGRVPWVELQKNRKKYIEGKYLPKKITLQQFHKMCKDDVNALLLHWMTRQDKGEVPLRFKKADKAADKNHRASNGRDGDANIEPGEEADESSQDDDGSEEQESGPLQRHNDSAEQVRPDQSSQNAAENPDGVSWLLNMRSS